MSTNHTDCTNYRKEVGNAKLRTIRVIRGRISSSRAGECLERNAMKNHLWIVVVLGAVAWVAAAASPPTA